MDSATTPDWNTPTQDLPEVETTLELPLISPELHSPRVRALVFGGIGAVVLLLGGLVVAFTGRDQTAAAPPATRAPARTAAVAALQLAGGTEAITVRVADLGDALYRVEPPSDHPATALNRTEGPPARATETGADIRLELPGGRVEVVLAAQVLWDLHVDGAAAVKRIDLGGAQLRTVALSGGATQVELTLPPPDGTLTVRMADGVHRFDLRTTGSAPVRVRFGAGAGNVILGGESRGGAAAGAQFTPDRWEDTADRVDLDAAGGMAQLTVSGT